jgi:uncharacterized membrane protein YjjP (DUF1212 family)
MTDQDPYDRFELQAFVVRLGAAMNAAGEPVYNVQSTLARVAAAYGVTKARISAYPTSLFVTLGRGESATLEMTTPLSSVPRLDQISALHELIADAEHGRISPSDGLERINEIRDMPDRFGPLASIAGYSVLTIGLCLILHPAPKDVAIAAIFGALVGVLRHVTRHVPTLQVLLPVIAAFCIAAATALAVKHNWADPGLRSMIASLVVFLPGAALTTAILELTAGDMVAGASRLVWAGLQLLLLAFGIVAGIEASGITAQAAFSSHSDLLGSWAPWVGVLIFAVGVIVSHQVPPRASWALVVVLYSAWIGQVLGNHLIGGYASGLIGAVVMTPVATLLARLKSAMPVYAMFLPGFWLLVPGAISLIGLTAVATNTSVTGAQDFLTAVGSIVAVAVGVLLGTQLTEWLGIGYRVARRTVL